MHTPVGRASSSRLGVVRVGLAGCALKHPASLCNTKRRARHNATSMTEYRCVTNTIAGFIQQLAVSYVGRGYWFYVAGRVPNGKDPPRVDAKLVERYGIGISKWTRARRKRLGLANMQYIRHGRFFVLLATHGSHPFFKTEKLSIRDVRRTPVKYGGYAVSYRDGHPHVRIERREYLRLRSWLLDVAAARGASGVRAELSALRFEPYAPVRRQLLNLLRAANRELSERGHARLGASCLRLRRTVGPVFGESLATAACEHTQVPVQGSSRGDTARSCPGDELGDIDAAFTGLTVVDPGLGTVQV